MPAVSIVPFDRVHLDRAADLVVDAIALLRSRVPAVPEVATDAVAARLDGLFDVCPGIAAVRGGQLVGFLGWFILNDFRHTGRRAAYCPVWAHAAIPEGREETYHRLYQEASRQWLDAGSHTHAVTLFAHDTHAEHALFWNGFGLSVVDAVRLIGGGGADSAPRSLPGGVTIRRATPSDLQPLAVLESEHWCHCTQPPTLMPARDPDLSEIHSVLTDRVAGYWLAEADDRPVGFLRVEPATLGAVDIFSSGTMIAISRAFVLPSHRRRGIATALMDTALDGYRDSGFTHCSVDFESFNPEARNFWPRTFHPACLSVIRRPEATPVDDPS